MGTVPVAPRSNRLVSEGDRKVSGFKDKPVALGLNNMVIIYMPTFTAISDLTNWSGSRNTRPQGLFFHQDPGRAVLQKGHFNSEALISLLQLGQRIDCLWGFAILFTIIPVPEWSSAFAIDTKFSLLYDITLYHEG